MNGGSRSKRWILSSSLCLADFWDRSTVLDPIQFCVLVGFFFFIGSTHLVFGSCLVRFRGLHPIQL